MKKTSNNGKAKLFGKEIPLTNTGKINKTYLTKDEKELYEKFENKQKEQKKEYKLKELEEYFSTKK